MYCKRCENEIPDNSVRCPACGFPIRTVRSKQHRRVGRTIIATDVLTIVMSIINVVLLVSGAHYATDLYNGGWFAVRMAFFAKPLVAVIDILYLLVLLPFPFVSVVARHKMQQARQTGLIMMTSLHAALLVWSVTYPLLIFFVTGAFSPVFTFFVWQISLFTLLSATSLVYLWHSERIIF